METQFTVTRKSWYVVVLLIAAFAFNPVYGQSTEKTTTTASQKTRTIKGVVSNVHGVLEDVNVILKGTNEGTITNEKGEYTFPVALKDGDILLFSYLGYRSVEVKIKPNMSFIETVLSDEVIEFMGDLNTNKRYKSKRTH